MSVLRLGSIEVDPATGEVCGPGGREHLDPKVMQVLGMLARRGGEVISRDELLATLWPGVVVTDDALTRCIYQLRAQLTRAAGDSRYRALIETLPKRGYRLDTAYVVETSAVTPAPKRGAAIAMSTADVETSVSSPPVLAFPGKGGARAAAAAVAVAAALAVLAVGWILGQRGGAASVATTAPAAALPSVAVMPFDDLSEQQDQRWFAEGLAEEVLTALSLGQGIRVIARQSSFGFAGGRDEVGRIAADLGASHVLGGSVRRAGSIVRVTAQLVSTADGTTVWSRAYDRELGDALAVQDEIARAVAAELNARLRARGGPVVPADPRALERYLQGRYFFQRRGVGDVERSRRYLEEAVEIDPSLARAWAALAGVYAVMQTEGGLDREQSAELQGHALERAVTLDPSLAEAHARLAVHRTALGDRALARRHLDRAVELDPHSPLVLGLQAGHALYEGRLEEAIALNRRALASDPISAVTNRNYGVLLMAAGRLPEARAALSRAHELSPSLAVEPDAPWVALLILERREREALAAVEKWPAGLERTQFEAILAHSLGRTSEAAQSAALLAAVPSAEAAARAAEIHAFRGDADETFRQLDAMLARLASEPPDALGARSWLLSLQSSPFMSAVRKDPRWAQWIAAYRAL